VRIRIPTIIVSLTMAAGSSGALAAQTPAALASQAQAWTPDREIAELATSRLETMTASTMAPSAMARSTMAGPPWLLDAGSPARASRRGGKATRRGKRNRPDKTVDEDSSDITDSARALAPGSWQVEMGWSFQSLRDETQAAAATQAVQAAAAATAMTQTTHEMTAPQALVRLGVTSHVEMRLSVDGFLSDSSSAPGVRRVSGLSDLDLACKIVLIEEAPPGYRDGFWDGFGLGLIPGVSMPVGSGAFTSGGFDPALTVVWDRSMPRGFDASGTVSVAALTDHGARFTQTLAGASLGRDFRRGWSGFWDLTAFSALTRGGAAAWFADGGVQHHLGRNVQFDVSLGHRLRGPAPDWVLSAGLAIRRPHHRRLPIAAAPAQ
jgi:hypothetical protein